MNVLGIVRRLMAVRTYSYSRELFCFAGTALAALACAAFGLWPAAALLAFCAGVFMGRTS